MFEQFYPFHLVGKQKVGRDDLISISQYSFDTKKNKRYRVDVEEYSDKIFVVKFYPKSLEASPDKFKVILNDYDAPRIIRTCVNIMLAVLEKEPDACFGFVASNIISPDYIEPKYYNKRYRIYKQLMADWFPDSLFLHHVNETNSAYLLLNRKKKDLDSLAEKVIRMFIQHYPELDSE